MTTNTLSFTGGPIMKLMSIQAKETDPVVIVSVPSAWTLLDVLERAVPHMGPDNNSYEPPVATYDTNRFRHALGAAGITVPYVQEEVFVDYAVPKNQGSCGGNKLGSLDTQAGVLEVVAVLREAMP